MPPALRPTIPGSTASTRSCTPSTFSCTCAFSSAGSSDATGPNVAVPAFAHRIEMLRVGQLVAQLGAFGRVGQVDGAHLDRHAVLPGEPVRQRRSAHPRGVR